MIILNLYVLQKELKANVLENDEIEWKGDDVQE